jgi:hypothetical protein
MWPSSNLLPKVPPYNGGHLGVAGTVGVLINTSMSTSRSTTIRPAVATDTPAKAA